MTRCMTRILVLVATLVATGRLQADPGAQLYWQLHRMVDEKPQRLGDRVYRPKYKTIGHLLLAYEADRFGVNPNYQLLDWIIDTVRKRVRVRDRYSRREAVVVLRTIHEVLKQPPQFLYRNGVELLSDTLRLRRLDAATVRHVRAIDTSMSVRSVREFFGRLGNTGKLLLTADEKRYVLAHPDRRYAFYDCSTITLIYLSVCDALRLNAHMSLAPRHMFVRCRFSDGRYMNWECTVGAELPDRHYVEEHHISKAAIRSGVYLSKLRTAEAFAQHIAELWGTRSHYSPGERRQAQADLTLAIRVSPTSVNALMGRARLRSDDDPDGAIVDCNAAIRLDPSLEHAYRVRARAGYAKGDLDGAIADFTQAISLSDAIWIYAAAKPLNLYARGMMWHAKQEHDRAIADYTAAIRLNPRGFAPYYFRARSWLAKKDYDRAVSDLEAAARLDPKCLNSSSLREKLCRALRDRGRAGLAKQDHDQAVSDLAAAVRLTPECLEDTDLCEEFSRALRYRGRARHRRGDLVDAIADFTRAIEFLEKIPPKRLLSWKWEGRFEMCRLLDSRAEVWLGLGRLDRALADAKASYKWVPTDDRQTLASVLMARARACAGRRDWATGAAELREAWKASQAIVRRRKAFVANVFVRCGESLWEAGQTPKAIESYEWAVRVAEAHTSALARLVWIYGSREAHRKPRRAIQLAEMAVEADRTPESLDLLAHAHAYSGDFDKAQAVEREALALAQEQGRPGSHYQERIDAFGKGKTVPVPGLERRPALTHTVGGDGKEQVHRHTKPGSRWVAAERRAVWSPGSEHPRWAHVVAADKEGSWHPAPGYRWVNPHGNGDLRVVWTPGSRHPRNPSAVAGAKPGQWTSSYFVTRRGARGSG